MIAKYSYYVINKRLPFVTDNKRSVVLTILMIRMDKERFWVSLVGFGIQVAMAIWVTTTTNTTTSSTITTKLLVLVLVLLLLHYSYYYLDG